MEFSIYRINSNDKVKDKELEKYFREIARRETLFVDNNGIQWPEMRMARPEWFDL